MASTKRLPIDGDSNFSKGMVSHIDPVQLPDGTYRVSMNTVNRGGLVQCRPGYDFKLNIPEGHFQGGALFQPFQGLEQIMFAVSGRVYVSTYPFDEFTQVPGIELKEDAEHVYFEETEKGSQYNEDGSISIIAPFRVMMIQDGYTAPVAWDGSTALVLRDPDETPLGTLMKWNNNRLWIARGRELFAGDIYDPLSNREGVYLSNASSFLLDAPIVAMAEVTLNSGVGLLVFTNEKTYAFQSYVQQRSAWNSTPDFMRVILPNIGCLSHRSVAEVNGVLWWWSAYGLINLDAALAANQTSEIEYQDLEMARSKGWLGETLHSVAVSGYENYLLASVPYADLYNTHTWVLDTAPAKFRGSQSPDAWNSFWTGTRPIQWLHGHLQGRERSYHFSRDYDGKNRLWEAFSDSRTDNGCPIIWTLETRAYNGGSLNKKQFRWARVFLSELEGAVDLAVFWAGAYRGAFKRILTKRIVSSVGPFAPGVTFSAGENIPNLKKQTRIVETSDAKVKPLDATSCDIESALRETVDVGFQLFIVASGPGAVRAVQLVMDEYTEDSNPDCEGDEDEETNLVRSDGVGRESDAELSEAEPRPEIFTSAQSVTVEYNGEVFQAQGFGESRVSQKDADKIALCHAQNDADIWLMRRMGPVTRDDPVVS